MAAELDLTRDVVDLAADLIAVESVSGGEEALADAMEAALRSCDHLEVLRFGNCVVARTQLGRAARVVLAGHLDTVPLAPDAAAAPIFEDGADWSPVEKTVDAQLRGRGSVDMKAGDAVLAHAAATITEPRLDVTYVFYDNEEVAAGKNGLGKLAAAHPAWLAGDLAVLGEPTNGGIEGGCNGSLRVRLDLAGIPAHSARPWMGHNAIHDLTPYLARISAWPAQTHDVDGLQFIESILAVGVSGGAAVNVVPDAAALTINYRFAPDRSPAEALSYLCEVLEVEHPGIAIPDDVGVGGVLPAAPEVSTDAPEGGVRKPRLVVVDAIPGSRPGMDHPEFATLAGLLAEQGAPAPTAKLGWTDVARFSALGVPAVNCGPGNALMAHTLRESVRVEEIRAVSRAFTAWLRN